MTVNISKLFKDDCKYTINDMPSEIYNLHITLKSLTKENARIKSYNALLNEKNAH